MTHKTALRWLKLFENAGVSVILLEYVTSSFKQRWLLQVRDRKDALMKIKRPQDAALFLTRYEQ